MDNTQIKTVRYRTELFSGTGERDAAEVMAFDTYEVGEIVLSDIGYDGTLYGYTELPVCLEEKLEALQEEMTDLINELESDDLSSKMEEELNSRYLEVDNSIQEIKQIISNKEDLVSKTKNSLDEKLNVAQNRQPENKNGLREKDITR